MWLQWENASILVKGLPVFFIPLSSRRQVWNLQYIMSKMNDKQIKIVCELDWDEME
jgi:hypothetical protein